MLKRSSVNVKIHNFWIDFKIRWGSRVGLLLACCFPFEYIWDSQFRSRNQSLSQIMGIQAQQIMRFMSKKNTRFNMQLWVGGRPAPVSVICLQKGDPTETAFFLFSKRMVTSNCRVCLDFIRNDSDYRCAFWQFKQRIKGSLDGFQSIHFRINRLALVDRRQFVWKFIQNSISICVKYRLRSLLEPAQAENRVVRMVFVESLRWRSSRHGWTCQNWMHICAANCTVWVQIEFRWLISFHSAELIPRIYFNDMFIAYAPIAAFTLQSAYKCHHQQQQKQ